MSTPAWPGGSRAVPAVKICCIASPDEAALAIRHGARALGLVSAMPSGPGIIDEGTIAMIAGSVPPGIDTFLLTSLTEPGGIVAQHRRCRTTTLQLCDRVAPDVPGHLRRQLPGVRIVQVVHVTGPDSVAEAEAAASGVDALLLDSGNPSLAVKELGGTGRVHDWTLSRQIVARVACPVFLAGGLNPTNVARAVDAVRPAGLDLCSGVRVDGRLDEARLAAFFAALRPEEAGRAEGGL